MTCSVYWIHHPKHTDMFTQGYVGITNNTKTRWNDHNKRPSNLHIERAIKKYGWDSLVKEVILISSRGYCLDIEVQLRPKNQIGWNVVLGGGNPPSSLGKKFIRSDEYKAQMSISKMGQKHTPEMQIKLNLNLTEGGKATRFIKGSVPYNKGIPALPHVVEAVRKANLGSKHTQEHKDKISLANIGRVMNDYTKQKLKEANLGRESAMKGKHFPKVKCTYCEVSGGIIPMKRWHMDNCKNKGVL